MGGGCWGEWGLGRGGLESGGLESGGLESGGWRVGAGLTLSTGLPPLPMQSHHNGRIIAVNNAPEI